MHERSHTFRLSVTKIKLSILFSAPLMGNPLGRGADDHCGTWKKKKKKKIMMSSLLCLMIKDNYFFFFYYYSQKDAWRDVTFSGHRLIDEASHFPEMITDHNLEL